jgi:hypothetical protein
MKTANVMTVASLSLVARCLGSMADMVVPLQQNVASFEQTVSRDCFGAALYQQITAHHSVPSTERNKFIMIIKMTE